MSELKPCPVCGGNHIRIDKCTGASRCLDCFCKGPFIALVPDRDNKTEEQLAVEAWNTRKQNENH